MKKASRGVFLSVLILGVIAFLVVKIYAGFACKYASHNGTVSGLYIDLGNVIRTDLSNGSSTEIRFPFNFDHGDKTLWTKDQIKTTGGDFILKVGATLAGNKAYVGWNSKTNDIVAKLYRESVSEDNLIETKTLNKSVGSPKSFTIEFSQVTHPSDQDPGEARVYVLEIYSGKSDGKDNEGTCTNSFKVTK